MTEAEWLVCASPDLMVEHMRFRGRHRQMRLVACAACRRIWHLMTDDRCRQAVEASEQHADGNITYGSLDRISAAAEEAVEEAADGDSARGAVAYAASAASNPDLLPEHVIEALRAVADVSAEDILVEFSAQATLFHDIFGNPFRPVTFSPEWRTDTAVALAQQMYESRDFSAMPILADALQDAGCDSNDILNHCRDTNQVHVRRCWVLDLVLGKS